jgi:hypothetical protein
MYSVRGFLQAQQQQQQQQGAPIVVDEQLVWQITGALVRFLRV